EVAETQAGRARRFAKLGFLREADAVRRALHGEVTDLPRVTHRAQEVGAQRRLTARELHAQLSLRLHAERVVEDLVDVVPRELVHEADLVRVHEARVAHHVAAVREIDGEHGAAAVFDRGGTVFAQRRLRGGIVTTWKQPLDAREERG